MQYLRGGRRKPVKPSTAGDTGVGSFAKPRAVAVDYRTDATAHDAAALTLHKKYPISILGMLTSQAPSGQSGYAFVEALIADNPNHLVAQYTIDVQQFATLADGGATYTAIGAVLAAGDTSGGTYFVTYGNGAGSPGTLKMKSPVAVNFSSWEVDVTSTRLANADGKRAPQICADGYKGLLFDHLVAAAGAVNARIAVFKDNAWGNPGSMSGSSWESLREGGTLIAGTAGDYGRNGTNDSYNHGWALRNSGVNPAFRQGQADYFSRHKSNFPGIKVIANADFDFINDATFGNCCLMNAEFQPGGVPLVDYAFLEAVTHNNSNDGGCIAAYRSSFADTLNRLYTAEDSVNDGIFVCGYLKSTSDGLGRTLQKARFTLGVAMLADNGYAAIEDRLTGSANMRPYWIAELDQLVGSPSEPRPTAPLSNGWYRHNHTNGAIYVNPTQNKGRWMGNGPVTSIGRSGNVVTLTMPTANAPAGITAGMNIRIWDCTSASSTTFNGVWALTEVSTSGANTLFKWAQTAANTATFTNPLGYWGFQTSLDLTGLGLRRIVGTDSGTPTLYNGTPGVNTNDLPSQNDGSAAAVVFMWPDDAVLLVNA
jgi:hypothetical protein